MLGDTVWVIFHAKEFYLGGHMLSVLRFHQKLRGDPPFVDVVIIARKLYISRVEQIHPVVFDKGGSGINAIPVLRNIPGKNRLMIIPVKQVTAGAVTPVSAAAMYI